MWWNFGSIFKFDGEDWFLYQPPGLGKGINVIRQAPDGKIFFGTNGDGTHFYDGEEWTNYKTNNSGIASDQITAIAFDIDGKIWFGTKELGISVLDGEKWSDITTSSGLASLKIRAIAIDSAGGKWIGTQDKGISFYDNNRWVTYNPENSGLTASNVSDIYIEPSGMKWFATDGICSFDGDNWKSYSTTDNGLLSWKIDSIVEDSKGRKWIGNSNSGLILEDHGEWIS